MSFELLKDDYSSFSDAPHEAHDSDKVQALVAAYEQGAPVNPVVFIEYADRPAVAVTGSHRLAAMAQVFDSLEQAQDAGYALFVPETDEIESILDSHGVDFDMVAWALRKLDLPTEVLDALADQ